ncbi:MAG: TonB-dependent receptor [Gammaproteobacteria bacterium]|nr:TonB-dependent receptor [Gammaproteobacteria bacterium]
MSVSSMVAAQEDEATLEEIVVTARFREERLQETPIAITAITAADINARAFTSAYEVGYVVPNAAFRPAQSAYGNTMTAYVRGIGQYDFDFAFEPGVGVYVDDVYQPFILGSQLDLLNVERVEVLRGPQGTLFGRGSIGGVVRLVSDKPEGDNSGSITIRAGNFERTDVRASYDFALADNLFAEVAGAARHREGYQDVIDFACRFPAQAGLLPVRDPSFGRNCKTGTQGGEDMAAIRGQLRWVASDNVEVLVAGDYYNDESEPRADSIIAIQYPLDLSGEIIPTSGYTLYNNEYLNHVPTADEPWGYGIPYDERFIPDTMYETYATYNDPAAGLTFAQKAGLERKSLSGTLNWGLGENLNLTAVLATVDIKSDLVSDTDASPFNLQTTGGIQELDWTTAELRLNGRAMDRLDWTVGAFYYTGEAANYQAVSFPPILWGVFRNVLSFPPAAAASIIEGSPVSVNTRNEADIESKAVFGHVVFDLSDSLALNAGIRYSEDTKDVAFDNTFVQAPINIDFDHTDWRLGLDFKFSDDMLLYGSAASGYRPPAYNPRPFTPAQAIEVGGEEATSYEFGLKTDWFDRKLRANLALFYTDYNKRIVPIGGTECVGAPADPSDPGAIQDTAGNVCFAVTSLTNYEQLSDGEVTGAELEVNWQPVENLLLSAIFGYTNWSSPEIDNCDFNEDGQPDAGYSCTNRPNFVPENNWALAASYDFALANGSRVTPRIDIYGQTEICSSVVSQLACADGYELVSLRLEWESPEAAWTVAVGGTNVTDEEYILNIFDLTLFGQNTVEAQPGRPQEWYLEFGRRF